MLKDGQRRCDICNKTISGGEPYFARLVERDHVPRDADIPRTGLAVDALGNVRVDVCHHCQTGMNLSGDVTVD